MQPLECVVQYVKLQVQRGLPYRLLQVLSVTIFEKMPIDCTIVGGHRIR